MKVSIRKIIKSCNNCANAGKEIPHTCDECDSLNNPPFYMWEHKPKNQISLNLLRQFIFDCAMDLQYGYRTKDYIVDRLIDLSNIKVG